MIKRYGQGKYLHRAVEANGVLYLVGMTPVDKSTDIKGQTRQVLEKMEQLLDELGSSKSRVLTVSVYLTDMALRDGMTEAWTEFFAPEELPARATIGVSDLGPGVLIEIVATALAGRA